MKKILTNVTIGLFAVLLLAWAQITTIPSNSGGAARETLLDSMTVTSGVTEVDLTGESGYNRWILEIEGATVTVDDSWIAVQLNIGGLQSTGYKNSVVGSVSPWTGTNDSGILLISATGSKLGNAASEALSSTVVISDPDNTTNFKDVYGLTGWTQITGQSEIVHFNGAYQGGTGAITAVRIIPESGNIDGGTFKLVGISN